MASSPGSVRRGRLGCDLEASGDPDPGWSLSVPSGRGMGWKPVLLVPAHRVWPEAFRLPQALKRRDVTPGT